MNGAGRVVDSFHQGHQACSTHLANPTQHGMDVHRIGAQEDEAARAYGRDFISAPGIGGGIGVGERANWLQKVKDAIRKE